MTRFGVHVKDGPRNGFGKVAEAQCAMCFSVGENAGEDAKIKSEGHTVTIYRTALYNNHPEGVGLNNPDTTRDECYAIADMFWPLLLEEFEQNPADYYSVLNESGANDLTVIKNYVWYEWRMMEHAEPAGYKLCLQNLFSGTPDDGSVGGGSPDGGMERWKEEYGPLLKRGYEGGHIYGRHAYGYPMLIPLDFNSDRPFREAEWLKSQGIYIGVAITECGLHGGEYQDSVEVNMQQIAGYDAVMQQHRDMIVGCAWWTYGNWDGSAGHVNIQTFSDEMALYCSLNYSPAWKPIDYIPPPNGDDFPPNEIKHTIHLLPQDATEAERIALVRFLAPTNTAFTHSHDVAHATLYHGTPESKLVVWDVHRFDYDVEEYFKPLGVGYEERNFIDLIDETRFRYQVWPVDLNPKVTQHWANNPEYYQQFCEEGVGCLHGHGGVDMRAPEGTIVRAVAPGRVVRVHQDPSTHNFGRHVYIEHEPHNELTGYAHLLNISNVQVGQWVEAGEQLGTADNSGNSFGHHLHFLRKQPGVHYKDEHGVWPYFLADPTDLLRPLAPAEFEPKPPPPPPPPPGKKVDMLPYMAVDAPLGPLYEVQTQYAINGGWRPGPQQRHQTHVENGKFFHTKGGEGDVKPAEWEELMSDMQFIYRGVDTSPADDQSEYYELRDDPNAKWSKWAPRNMAENESYQRYPFVNFYLKDGCSPIGSDHPASLIILEKIHDDVTFFTGINLTDVIQLVWTDLNRNPIERYWYAKGYGLVGWEGRGRRAAISEIHEPGARPDNVREVIDCL